MEIIKKLVNFINIQKINNDYELFKVSIEYILRNRFNIAYSTICKYNIKKDERNILFDWKMAYDSGLSKENRRRYLYILKNTNNIKHAACSIYCDMSGISTNRINIFYKEYFNEEYNIENSIRTINSKLSNQRELSQYKSSNIEKYIYVATLDKKTCHICGSLDRKIFNVNEAKEGVNLPPMHEGCRCTTRAYFKNIECGKRIAKDPKTGKNYYIDNMSYDEWIKTVNINNKY